MVSMVYGEWELLLESIRIGILLGFVYDGIRILRMCFSHPTIIRDLEDALYWVISTLLILELQMEDGKGIFRGFSIGTVFLTMIIYHKVLAVLWIPRLELLINRIKNPLTKGLKVLRMKVRKQITNLLSNRRKYGKEENSGTKEKAESSGNDIGYDGGSCYDAGGSSK